MIRGLAFVEVVVEDFDAMIKWYTEVLGFRLGEDKSNADRSECWQELLVTIEPYSVKGANTVPSLIALWKPAKPSQKPEPAGRVCPCFLPILRVCGIDSFVKNLRSKKVVMLEETVRDCGSFRITTIADPEGNPLQLYEEKANNIGNAST